jgi:hypothetical protein
MVRLQDAALEQPVGVLQVLHELAARAVEAPGSQRVIHAPHQGLAAEGFEGKYGSTQCRVLLGCDVSNPEEARVAREKDLFTPVCMPMIRDAVEWLEKTVTPCGSSK